MTSKFRSLVVFASCLAVVACGDDGTSPEQPQSRIEILPAEAESLRLGDTLRLMARRVDANGLPLANDSLIHFLWQSSDTTVLVVDSYGLVEAMDFGTATISVRITDTVSIMFPHPTDTAFAAVELTSRPDVIHPGPVEAMAVVHPFHACVLLVDGKVECRGRNDSGQIGIGTITHISENIDAWSVVSGGHTFSSISTSYFHTCGMTTDGRPHCWGTNGWRNLDMELDVTRMPVPAEFGEDYRWTAVHAGGDGRTCGITTEQVPMCAGRNGWGQTGHDGEWQQPLREWGSGHRVTAIKTNLYRTCAIVAGGALYCSGRDFLGSRGGYVPFLVDSSGVVLESFDIGDAHGCGLTANGKAYCWGYNPQGQLGTGDLTNSESMRPVVGGHVFTSIHTGAITSCGLTTAGEVWCWGAIGRSRTRPDSSSIPVRVPLAPGVKALSLTVSGGPCIVDASRRMSCWSVADSPRWAGTSALAQNGGPARAALPSTPPPQPSTPPPD